MASDIYLKIDGIIGGNTDSAHMHWIQVISFSRGVNQSSLARPSLAVGGTAGLCKREVVEVSKYIDIASPKLHQLCRSGEHIKRALMEFWRPSSDGSGTQEKYMTIGMEEVVISKIEAGPNIGNDRPIERVWFNCGNVTWTYTHQSGLVGAAAGNVPGGWSTAQN